VGTTRMSASKSNGSTTRKSVLWAVPTRIGRRGTPVVSGTLRAQISSDARKSSWRGRISNGDLANSVAALAMKRGHDDLP
jgi:hypothetical protein